MIMKIFQLLFLIGIVIVYGCSTQEPSAITSVKECKSDIDCFIKASESCTMSSFEHTIIYPLEPPISIKNLFTLNGMVDGKCSLLIELIKEANTVSTQECIFDSNGPLTSVLKKSKEIGYISIGDWQSYCKEIRLKQELNPT